FSVTYSTGAGIDPSSIDQNDLLVTGPHGYRQRASFVSITAGLIPGSFVAVYSIPASKGTWGSHDNGSYKVNLQAGQVLETSGNALSAQVVGYFSVSIS